MHFPIIEVILALLLAVAALAHLAQRLEVPYPLMLVIGGLMLGFVPGLPHVTLNPDYVFLLFLPPLLYYGAVLTSWRDFRANLRPISLLAVGLTLFTTVVVAYVTRLVVPGIPLAAAFVLGAIVSPPDAIAATAVANKLRVPRRIVTILEGESLVNDAIALVAYRFAVAAAVTGAFSLPAAALRIVIVSVGGIIIGLLAGVVVTWLRPKLHDHVVETTVSLLTPFIAYLPAEHLGVSGVLATVAAGLYIARSIPRTVSAATRLRAYAVWDVFVFILNGLVFILIGLQLPGIVERLGIGTRYSWSALIRWSVLISATTVAVRLLWVFPATYVPRWLIPAIARRDPAPPPGSVFLIAWTGMRGIVSLAAALSLPAMAAGGSPFPGRDLIIFTTFAVILVTLLVQGLSLPWVIRALGVRDEGLEEQDEEAMARYLTALAAVERIDTLANGSEQLARESVQRVRGDYDGRLAYYSQKMSLQFGPAESTTDGNPDTAGKSQPALRRANISCSTEEQLRREALSAERNMLVKLRDDGTISDEILRRVQRALDLEESRLDEE
ncbi:MAG TPA: Na+/H+ antiporter [Tepidisphaeraceae bacterium]|jgi:CPA1 family monovalent cation:H+ antiporter